MKFQVQSQPFQRMVELVGSRSINRRSRLLLRLVASEDHLRVECEQETAQIDAEISEEGQCTLSRARLLGALKRQGPQAGLAVKADRYRLHLGNSTLSVQSYRSQPLSAGTPQSWFASEWGIVASNWLNSVAG